MASDWIHECIGAAVNPATTEYFPLVGDSDGETVEANTEILVRDTYTGKNLWTYVSANANNGTTTIRTRKNGANGAQSVSYAASETGSKEDTVNTDAMATGELWNYSVNTAGATGNCTFTVISILLQHSGTGTFILAGGRSTSQAENVLNYFTPSGSGSNSETEATRQYTLRTDGTLRNFRIYVSSNSIGADTVARTRKNAGNGAQSVTITASTTGSFEDTTNSDTVTGANADEWNYVVNSTSAKMGTLATRIKQVEYACIGRPHIGLSADFPLSSDSYIGLEGGASISTVEANRQVKARVALTVAKMFTYVSANTTTVCDVYFRQNGVNTSLTVNYGSGVTGIKEDTVNSVSIVATDLINYFVDLTSGTSITFQIIGSEAQQAPSNIPPGLGPSFSELLERNFATTAVMLNY